MAQTVKNLPAMQKFGFNPWVRKIPGEGNGNPLQYSRLENPMGGEAGGLCPWGHRHKSDTQSDTTERLTTHSEL